VLIEETSGKSSTQEIKSVRMGAGHLAVRGLAAKASPADENSWPALKIQMGKQK
jgi:hypothetical protein